MADLSTEIIKLKGIGEKKAQALNRLGVFTLYDLITYFPRRYEDRTVFRDIDSIEDGETVCIHAVVADTPRLTRVRRGMDLVKFRAVDNTGAVNITYFNQSYVKDNIHLGDEYIFFGRVETKGKSRSMTNPVYEKEDHPGRVTGVIMPVYRMCSGINQKAIIQSVRQGLDICGDILPEILPESVRKRNKLAQARYAYENIHFPSDFKALQLSRDRLVFEELFVLACAMGRLKENRIRENGIKARGYDISVFYSSLPFVPTNAQKRAVNDAVADMQSGYLMNRLVQGDVGSGKTLVAAAICWYMKRNGFMSAFMAPTEILAEQHVETFRRFLSPFGMNVERLTGSMTVKEKRAIKERLKNGEIDVLIGTHALFTDDVEYRSLGLVITDEQHRFGVAQRSKLIAKGIKPHVLVMSATPIPRTLALIIYGDLDVSIIDEMPPGRQTVDTFAVNENYRERLNSFILKQVKEGHQVFVVCPMVEENEDLDFKLKSAEEHTEELRSFFPDLAIGCVHGKMKPKEKDRIMSAFASGEIDVLVSTTVIEVGVDVPNATLMIVENAERFGLSQLHQLRGRVGRGKAKSYCVLVSEARTEETKSRLNIMCKTNDGFKISEEDLRIRGPGDFFGSRQHGLPDMHVANLGADTDVLKRAQAEAAALLSVDPLLDAEEHRQLKAAVTKLISLSADSFN